MKRDYDRWIDSDRAHKACRAQIRKLLAVANIQRKDDDFIELLITYSYIEELAAQLRRSAKTLSEME